MRLVSFHGRIDRPTFFVGMVLLYVLGTVFIVLAGTGAATLALDLPAKDIPDALRGLNLPKGLGWVCLVIGLLGILYVVLGTIGVSVRRLHDFGMTGFLVLVYPLFKHLVPDPGWPDWLPGPIAILWILILGAQPGTRGPNAFGPASLRDPPAEPDER